MRKILHYFFCFLFFYCFESFGQNGPELINFSPSDNTTEVSLGTDLVLIFDKPVRLTGEDNYFSIRESSTSSLGFRGSYAPNVTIDGNQVTITLNDPKLNPNKSYFVTIEDGVFEDLEGNDYQGFNNTTVWNFSTITTADSTPPVAVLNPADNIVDFNLDEDIVIVFDEIVNLNHAGYLLFDLSNGDRNYITNILQEHITVSNDIFTTATIDFNLVLSPNTEYELYISDGSFEDVAGNDWGGTDAVVNDGAYTFTTGENLSGENLELVSFTPDNGTTNVALNENLTLTFNKPVQLGDGTLNVFNDADGRSPVNTYTSDITINENVVTINPHRSFYPNKSYTVIYEENSFADLEGNPVSELRRPSGWNFSTVTTTDATEPNLVALSPSDNSVGFLDDSLFTITLSEDIVVQQVPDNFVLVKLPEYSTTEVVSANSSKVTINGNIISIDFEAQLLPNTEYWVFTPETLFQDTSGNAWGGIEDTDFSDDDRGWTFTTGNIVSDNEAPTITCPDNLEILLTETETTANVTLVEPTATDNVSTTFTYTGTRSDGLQLTEPYPIAETTVTWTATDQAGNISESCEQIISVMMAESEVVLAQDGSLTITDTNGGISDDNFALALDNGNMILSSNTPITISGEGVVQVDAYTVQIPLANITNGITLDGGAGANTLLLDTSLALVGVDNFLTLKKLNIQLTGTGSLQLNALNITGGNFDTNNLVTNISTEANFFTDATISGTGAINGVVNMNTGSNLNPGTSPGILNTGNLTLDNNNNNFEVDGPTPGTEHDQIVVTGTVTITPGTIINLLGGYTSVNGDEIILISNDGTEAITGTFDGLAQDAEVVFGEFTGTISYVGGDGNDLVLIGEPGLIPGAFVTTWQTDNPGVSESNQIRIPTLSSGYNYSVDWGDGNVDTSVTGGITHTYLQPGIYKVSITGDFPRIHFSGSSSIKDNLKILSIDQWGDIEWDQMIAAFSGCRFLDVVATDTPNLQSVTNMYRMFYGCDSLVGNELFNSWNTSNVTRMDGLFGDTQLFNQPIGGWDTSNVTRMDVMFVGAKEFDQPIDNWNTSSVVSMRGMFQSASNFNQDLNTWLVLGVSDMVRMFQSATSFDQNLSNWDVTNLTDASSMFNGVSLSTENYDALLNGWSTLDVGETQIPQNITFDGGNSQYCLSETARQNLIDTFGWTITDVGLGCPNAAPEITSTPTASVEEDQTIAINVDATDDIDVEGPGLTYSLTGDGVDQLLFNIDGVTGEVTFMNAPDFENPEDEGADNIYNFQVTVTDSGNLTATQDISIVVMDVDDTPPTLVSTSPIDSTTDVALDTDITFVFDEPVEWVPGGNNIVLLNLTTGVSHGVYNEGSLSVSFSGNTINIFPTTDLIPGNEYLVSINPSSVQDAAGNSFTGSSGNTFTFTTRTPIDNTSPVAICKDFTVELDGSGNATVSVTDIDNGSTDNEGIVTYGVQRRVARTFDQNVAPEVIFGSGNANGSFTNNQTGSVELGLRAKVRYPSPSNTFNSNGDGTYQHLAIAGSPTSRAGWNFEWSVNTDPTGTSSEKLNGLTYEMGIDFDASLGTDYYVFDPINLPLADHAIGNNMTANGGGSVATDEPGYAALLAANNVAQNSWNLDFFNELAGKTFDPTVDGTYEVYLKAFDGSGAKVGETKITVVVGNGGAPGMLAQSVDFTSADLGTNVVELIVVDAAGNVSICVSTVTVESGKDTESPVAICKDFTVELEGSGNATVSVTDIDNGSTDNEGIVTYGVQRRVARTFDQNVAPEVIFGSGNANGSFTNNQTGSVELGLRAKVRYPSPSNTFNSNGDGTYQHLAIAGSPTSRAGWNFEWSVNTDPTGTSSEKLNGLTYEMGIDFNASLGTDYYVFDPIKQPVADHSIGNNTTVNGGGSVATDEPGYAALLAANNVAQNSWNLDFFNELAGKTFDPTVDGTYEVYLKAFDGSGAKVGETKITVVVGNGGSLGVLPQNIDFTEADLGVNIVELIVVDAAGNVAICTSTVTIENGQDTESPLAVCEDITLELDENGTATVNVTDIDNGSTDNEGIVTYGVQRRVARTFDQNVAPEVIFGSGNANGSFTNNQTGSVELGLRAKVRYPSPSNTFNSNGDGSYQHLAIAGTPATRAGWNFEWSINTDPTGASGEKLNGLTYEMGIDFDASTGTDYYVFDPINLPLADHAIGNNTTSNGGGSVAADEPGYAALLAANNVAQNSWNLDFFNELAGKTFDPTVDGTYEVYLKAFDGSGAKVGETKITVVVGNGGSLGVLPQNIDFTEADLGANVVELIVVDATGNISVCTATVTIKSACEVVIEKQPIDVEVCEIEPYSWSVGATGNGTLSYLWKVSLDNGQTWRNYPNATESILNTPQGAVVGANGWLFRAIVTSDNGTPNDATDDCSVTSETAKLTINPIPVVVITGKDSYCNNGNGVELDAGAGHTSYLWSPGGATTQTITALEGSYTVQVTNEFGCTKISEAFIVTNNRPLVCNITQDVLTTDHETTDGVATVNVTGGTGKFTYLWDNGETTQTATTLTYGMHSVTVTDSNGCVTSCQIDIAKELYCWVNLSQNVSVKGGNDGAANVYGNGGYRPFSFKWDDGSTNQVNTTLTVGTHYVTITDATGATSQCSVTITEPTEGNCNDFTTNIEQQKRATNHITKDGVATVYPKGGSGQFIYLWDNGETTQTATTLTYGVHSVTVTDANGCESRSQINIAKELYCWTNLIQNVSVRGGNDGVASVRGHGGHKPFTFKWDDGSTNEINSTLSVGTHYVTITDASGATSQCSVTITEPNQEVCDGIDNNGDGQIDEGFDQDGDGTPDCTDDCDDTIDTDGDGIPDCTDTCDNRIDSDGDGISDCQDICPNIAGPVANQGCPWADTDGDGVLDKDDECPNVVGTVANAGCPDTCTLTITGQPVFVEKCLVFGDVTSLTVAVQPSNGATVSYQWQQSVNDGVWTPIISNNTNMLANIGFDSSTFMGYIDYNVIAMSDNGTPNDKTDDCTVTSAVARIHFLSVVTFQLPTSLQVDDTPVYLNMGSPTGGSYSGNGVGDDFNGRTIFDPAEAGVGVHTVTFTYTNENNCTQVVSNQIEVTMIPGVDCSVAILDQPEFTEQCLAFGDVASLNVAVDANNGATVGYQWEQSVNDGTWTPITSATTNMLADIGFDSPTFTGNVAYRVVAVSNNGTPNDMTDDCTVTSAVATIYSLSAVTLQLPSNFQVDDALISLNTGSPLGGTYSGNGVGSDPNGRPIFDPAQAGVGMHIIAYEYTNAGGCSNTATQEVTISMVPVPQEIYISEYQPNPAGSDPNTQIIELKGASGSLFNGWIILVDGDANAAGGVDDVKQVSGTFDGNGLLEVEIDDIENPSHTIIVSESYDVSMTDFDSNNDGQLDSGSIVELGTIYDALGVPDSTSDEIYLYGEQLGGADFKYTGSEPQLVFRDSQTNAWYAVNQHEVPIVHSITAIEIAFDQFTGTLTVPTFGELNPLLTSRSIGLKIQVWPNPSVKTINLQLSKTDKIDSYSIHDMTGKLIRTIKANHSLRQQLNIEDLQTGVYMIRASGANMATITQKFIKRN